MSRILALDTSSEACSAALWLDGRLCSRFEMAPRKHTQLLLPMVESLLAEAELSLVQLDAIAFGRGPGSFTGLRISAGVAQGLGFGADLPLLPISTLAALALRATQRQAGDYVLAMLDARMDELYWGFYQRTGEGVRLLGEEQVSPAAQVTAPSALLPEGAALLGCGPGWGVATELASPLRERTVWIDEQAQPDAAAMAQLAATAFQRGDGVLPEEAQPLYLRDKVALKQSERS